MYKLNISDFSNMALFHKTVKEPMEDKVRRAIQYLRSNDNFLMLRYSISYNHKDQILLLFEDVCKNAAHDERRFGYQYFVVKMLFGAQPV